MQSPTGEHPRPDFARARWASLDGAWRFRFDPDGVGQAQEWQSAGVEFGQQILVPFPWESRLSGLSAVDYRGVGWYRRTFAHPPVAHGERVHLCFGAVDWSCRVWVNQTEVGAHEGGYTPFRLDVTEALREGDNDLVVRVVDETDPHLPTGKQGGRWYTPCSGIWQPVWLEVVPAAHLLSVAVVPSLDPPAVEICAVVAAAEGGTLRLRPDDQELVEQVEDLPAGAGSRTVRFQLPLPDARLWTPETPQLYGYRLIFDSPGGRDEVVSYFGLRTIGTASHGDHRLITLNGEPVYLRGALHQVYHPDGLYTFPDEAARRHDVTLAKELGWNFLRLHIKLVDPRFLAWCDREGLLLMADLPCTWDDSPRARDAWEGTLREAVRRDQMHPALIAWCCFNESWGIGRDKLKQDAGIQAWVESMWRLTKRLDPTRLVEDNSPCTYDHVQTDLNSWHFYLDDYEQAREHIARVVAETYPGSGFNYCDGRQQNGAPLVNSEFGSVSAGGGDRDVSWGFKYQVTLLRAQPKVQGYVYTEHCDIEWEHNGLVGYDRTPKVFGYDSFVPHMTPADLQGADFVGYFGPPIIAVQPGQTLRLETFVSHTSARPGPVALRFACIGWDTLGRWLEPAPGAAIELEWRRAEVVRQTVEVAVPAELALGAVTLELFDGEQRLAANYVNLLARSTLPEIESISDRTIALRFAPNQLARFERASAEEIFAQLDRDKLSAAGRPKFVWRLRLPEALRGRAIEGLTLVAEIGARGGDAKLDWPARTTPQDYPQTKLGRATPTTVRARFGGVELGTVTIADDPADARGVLSHLAGWHHGSHGERQVWTFRRAANKTLLQRFAGGGVVELVLDVPDDAPAERAHGLSVYGATMGRYVLPPTLLVELAEPSEPLCGRESVAIESLTAAEGGQTVD